MKLGFGLGLLVLGLTSLGCGDDEEEFQYSREDMETAVFGTWTGTLTSEDATAVPLTLDIRARGDVARAPACAQRNFSDGSGTPGLELSCGPSSTLNVSTTLVVDAAETTELDGYFTVHGLTFSGGMLSVVGRGSEPDKVLTADFRDGAWTRCGYGEGAAVDGACTLDARVEE